jgi:hypothetical protein
VALLAAHWWISKQTSPGSWISLFGDFHDSWFFVSRSI